MPQHHPEDRVRVRNIVSEGRDVRQIFYLTRFLKEKKLDANGVEIVREIPYEKEVDWNFRDGFFFIWGGKAYMLKPGEEKTYPRFLAEHCVKQQVQHLLNEQYQDTKKVTAEGVIVYDRNILNNQALKKQIKEKAFVGVEDWYQHDDADFDSILSRKFGGDTEEYLGDGPSTSKEDFELGEIDGYEEPSLAEIEALKTPKKSKPTSDSSLQKLRDECDANAVEWNEGDTADQLKERLTKMMG